MGIEAGVAGTGTITRQRVSCSGERVYLIENFRKSIYRILTARNDEEQS